jgi:predicted CopG family antitoxin
MYKTISIHNDTYQNLQAIASQMEKPKSQIVDELIKGYIESMKGREKKELQKFNEFVGSLAKRVKLPKGAKINTQDLDKDFAALKDR